MQPPGSCAIRGEHFCLGRWVFYVRAVSASARIEATALADESPTRSILVSTELQRHHTVKRLPARRR